MVKGPFLGHCLLSSGAPRWQLVGLSSCFEYPGRTYDQLCRSLSARHVVGLSPFARESSGRTFLRAAHGAAPLAPNRTLSSAASPLTQRSTTSALVLASDGLLLLLVEYQFYHVGRHGYAERLELQQCLAQDTFGHHLRQSIQTLIDGCRQIESRMKV